MESKTIKENKNLSLNRTEYILDIKSEKNPSKADVIALLKSDAELTVVRKIDGSFGKDTFTVDAVVYNSAADKTKVETIPRKVRKKSSCRSKESSTRSKSCRS